MFSRLIILSIALYSTSVMAFDLPKFPNMALPEVSFPPLPKLPELLQLDLPNLPLPKLEQIISVEALSSGVDDFARSYLSHREYRAVHAVVMDVRARPLWWRYVAPGAVIIGGGSAAAGGICAQYLPIASGKAKTLCGNAAGVTARVVVSSIADLFGVEVSQEAIEFGASIGTAWGHTAALRMYREIDASLADEWYYPAVKELVVWSVGQLVN